ncbi:PTS transporter subunit IIC [Fusobacterium sp. PH5-44]|uniref:PTS transporter subunit IIC n=1 Tax=unclassified Fusobacterium TaxID=2648384 RepID=UPI003D24C5DC
MNKIISFLKKKDVEISFKKYIVSAPSSMAMGLFATLLVGTILKTVGEKFNIPFLYTVVWELTSKMMGPAIGVAVAQGLKAPPLVLFASTVTGAAGAQFGGPVGAFLAALIGAEFGKLVSKETKIDILVTTTVTLLVGILVANYVGKPIGEMMRYLGKIVVEATTLRPFLMGIIVSVVVGMVLTLPISSAALCMAISLDGLAGGAATVGCSVQMIGFAVMSFRENGWGGLVAQGLGTSMLQVGNIAKNWKIWIPPTLASAILGPVSTLVFKFENLPIGSGMGTCGLVGQIGTITAMENIGYSGPKLYIGILLLHFILPAIVTLGIAEIMRKKEWIKSGDMKLEL